MVNAIDERRPTAAERTSEGLRGAVHTLVRRYEWVHTSLGIGGNMAFLVGSVLFLWESTKRWGVYLFIIGSAGMLIGSVGAAIVKRRHERNGNGGSG